MLSNALTGLAAVVTLDAEDLQETIEEVMQRRHYQWRLPRTEVQLEEEEDAGPITSFFRWLWKQIGAGFEFVGEMLGRFAEWLEGLFPERPPKQAGDAGGWMTPVRLLLTAVSALSAIGLIYGLWKVVAGRRRLKTASEATPIPPPPDLATETTSADELPADRWLALARQMADQGDLRLAMRGFYLAILARLADRQLIRIESYKSNLEYKRELNRHAREKTELVVDFTAAIVHFEKIWYGLKSVSRAELDDYAGLYARIAGLADA